MSTRPRPQRWPDSQAMGAMGQPYRRSSRFALSNPHCPTRERNSVPVATGPNNLCRKGLFGRTYSPAARTIATMPAFTASGSSVHRPTIACRSASLWPFSQLTAAIVAALISGGAVFSWFRGGYLLTLHQRVVGSSPTWGTSSPVRDDRFFCAPRHYWDRRWPNCPSA